MSNEYTIRSSGVRIIRNFDANFLSLTREEWDQFVAFVRVSRPKDTDDRLAGLQFMRMYAKYPLGTAATATAYFAALEFVGGNE